jgi:hypothetical protein
LPEPAITGGVIAIHNNSSTIVEWASIALIHNATPAGQSENNKMLSLVSGLSANPGKKMQSIHYREYAVFWRCISIVLAVTTGISAVKRFLSCSPVPAVGLVALVWMMVARGSSGGDDFAPQFLI